MNKAEQLAYDEHINAIMIQNDVLSDGSYGGRQEGLARRMEEKQANARRMKALNLPVETICQVTGLSAGEIENLLNSVFSVLFCLPLYSWGMC